MDLADLYRDVIVDHNRKPAEFRRAAGCDAPAEGDNPLCGDQLHVVRRRRRRRDPRHALPGQRLRDLDGLGLADERGVKGKIARRGGRALRRGAPHADAAMRHGRRATRQARGALRRARIPGTGQVREPLLAHAQCGARGRAPRRSRRNEHAPRADHEPVVVSRDVHAVIVPAGVEVKLRHGQQSATSRRRSAAASRSTSRATCSASQARTPTRSARSRCGAPELPPGATDEDVKPRRLGPAAHLLRPGDPDQHRGPRPRL